MSAVRRYDPAMTRKLAPLLAFLALTLVGCTATTESETEVPTPTAEATVAEEAATYTIEDLAVLIPCEVLQEDDGAAGGLMVRSASCMPEEGVVFLYEFENADDVLPGLTAETDLLVSGETYVFVAGNVAVAAIDEEERALLAAVSELVPLEQ